MITGRRDGASFKGVGKLIDLFFKRNRVFRLFFQDSRLIFDLNINHITVKKLRFLSGIEGALGHLKGKNVVLFYMELCDESFQEGRVFVAYRKLQLLYLNHRSPFPADTPAMCPLAQAH